MANPKHAVQSHTELAQLFFNGISVESASKRFSAWLQNAPTLLTALLTAGYRPKQ
jgi:hypothetical protein